MSDKYWSRHILFLAPVQIILIALLLVLMFYTFKFFYGLYVEALIVIDIIGNWLNEISR